MKLQMPFVMDTTSLITTAGGFVTYNYRGNDIYDPDVVLGGDSGSGRAQWATLYKKYKVLSSTIIVECINLDTDDPLHVVVLPSKSGLVPGVAQKSALVGLPAAKNVTVTNQTGRGIVQHHCRTTEICNIETMSDDGYIAAMGDSPTHVWYWVVTLFNRSGNALNCEYRVKIVFNTVLSDYYHANMTAA